MTPDLPTGDPSQIVDSLNEFVSQDAVNATAYTSGSGEHVLDVTTTPQNFQTPSGSWAHIDPSLAPVLGGYRDVAGPIQTLFPIAIGGPLAPIVLSVAEGSLSMIPEGFDDGNLVQPTVGTVNGTTVTYAHALVGADLAYISRPDGYEEHLVLTQPTSANLFSWRVSAVGLGLRLESDGTISILSGDNPIGSIPIPVVTDAVYVPETGKGVSRGGFSYTLTDMGDGTYQIDVVFDKAWLSDPSRQYPVTIDPSPTITLLPQSDTDAGSNDTADTDNSQLTYLRTAGQYDRHTYINFNIASYKHHDRITYVAELQLARTKGSGTPVVKLVTSDWTASTTNGYNNGQNEPSVGDRSNGTVSMNNGWQLWEIGDIYQRLLDDTATSYGIQLSGSTYNEYYSGNQPDISCGTNCTVNVQPHLFLLYNDLPGPATLASPPDNASIAVQSPSLAVTALPDDPDPGDNSLVQFQVSDDGVNWTGSHLVWSSPFVDSKSYPVDAGALKDGKDYWWRTVSGDECDDSNGTFGVCTNKDAAGVWHTRPASQVRKFTVNLPHYGTDDRWAMWSESLGNGMNLQVNQANGNLFLDYPLDAMSTPIGPLAIDLTYNSQLPSTQSIGLGQGWTISAGPLSDGDKLPTRLVQLSASAGDGVLIYFRDGDRLHVPHIGGDVYRGVGAGAGTVMHSPNAPAGQPTWTYTSNNGTRYTFDDSGKLMSAKPTSDDWAKPGFDYSFDSSFRLLSVKDPLGRMVTLDWTQVGKVTVRTWDGRAWTIALNAAGQPSTITDPVTRTDGQQEKVAFSYGGLGELLSSVQNGEMVAHAPSQQTLIDYKVQAGTGATVAYKITEPGTTSPLPYTLFDYNGKLNGNIVSQAAVTDPRGTVTSSVNDYKVWTDFNTQGLPIRILGPYVSDGPSSNPYITRMVWDTNGNLVCSRSPYANRAYGEMCKMDPGLRYTDLVDAHNTDYTYQTRAPYKVLSETDPAPEVGPNATIRAKTSYTYDGGFTGLHDEVYDGVYLSGMPKSEAIDQTVNFTWASTGYHPPGLSSRNYWSTRLTGLITAPSDGRYLFQVRADDGVRLIIDHLFGVDCWGNHPVQINCGGGNVQKWLKANQPVPITIEYYHDGDSDGPRLELMWNSGNGTWQDVPASVLSPNLNLVTSSTDDKGTTRWSFPAATDKLKGLPASRTRGPSTTASSTDRTVTYTYDQTFGRVVKEQVSGLSAATIYHYTDQLSPPPSDPLYYCMDRVTDPTGAYTDYTCNDVGDITHVKQTVRTVLYPGTTNVLQGAQVRDVDTTYDQLGRVLSVSAPHLDGSPAGKFTYNAYDLAGRLVSVTDPMDSPTDHVITKYLYDPQGRLTDKILPLPDPANGVGTPPMAYEHYGYDPAGSRNSVRDADNHTWTTLYDAMNRVMSATAPTITATNTTNITVTAYSLANRTTTVTDASGVSTTTTFDLLGRKVSSQLGSLPPAQYSYDVVGNLIETKDPAGVYDDKTYNAFGEPDTESEPTGPSAGATPGAKETKTFGYDTAGRLRTVVDYRGDTYQYVYDDAGRITSSSLPWAKSDTTKTPLGTTSFVYDDAGEPVWVKDGATKVRTFTYDEWGNRAGFTDGNGNHTDYKYDYDRRLTKVTLPAIPPATSGPIQNFSYDEVGRRTRRWATVNGVTLYDQRYSFDPVGNMLTANTIGAPAYQITMGYDEANRARTVTETYGGSAYSSTTYAYDHVQLHSVSDDAGTTTFTYLPVSGLLDTVADPFSPSTPSKYGYDAVGRQSTRTDQADGLLTTRSYEPNSGRLRTQTTALGTATVASFTLGYDENSNVVSKTQTIPSVSGGQPADNGTWIYGYDEADRMTSAKDPSNVTTAYGYDGAGNRTTVQVGTGPKVTTTFDAAGYPLSADDGTTYSVDAIGETTGITRNNVSVAAYTYDPWGRLAHATTASPAADITYGYDALDRTMSRAKQGAPTVSYAYAGVSEDLDLLIPGGATPTKFAYSPGGPLAQQQGTNTRYYVTDFHEDVVALVQKTNGTLVGQTAYDPWGKKRATVGEQAVLGFQSDPTDSDTGLVDMSTRLYDPSQGRFNTRDVIFGDPANPLSLNQFSYTSGNPVSLNDPAGMYEDLPNKCAPSCGSHGCTDANCDVDPHPTWHPAPDYFLHSPTGTNTWFPQVSRAVLTLLNSWARRNLTAGAISLFNEGRLAIDSGFHPLTGCGAIALRCAWHATRFVLNAPFTGLAIGWAELTSWGKANCGLRPGLIVVCSNVPKWANGPGPRDFTVGSTILSQDKNPKIDSPSFSHEEKHADQWAIFGPGLPVLYTANEVAVRSGYLLKYELLGPWGEADWRNATSLNGQAVCYNIFERWAGLHDGGYTQC